MHIYYYIYILSFIIKHLLLLYREGLIILGLTILKNRFLLYCEEGELKSKITIKKDVRTETYSRCLMNKR